MTSAAARAAAHHRGVAPAGCGTCRVCRPARAAQPGNWESTARLRRDETEKVIRQNRASFNAFDTGSLGDATLEIETLSLSDLDELERWLAGDHAPVLSADILFLHIQF